MRNEPRGRRRKRKLHFGGMILVLIFAAAFFLLYYFVFGGAAAQKVKRLGNIELPNYVSAQIIEIDGAARRGEKLEDVKDIVVHYVGNAGTTAQQNHDYYGNPGTDVSSHFVIGLEGEVIQCIPLDEKSSASNWRNNDTISIEVCHPDETGEFTEASYNALVQLTAWLRFTCKLDNDHVIRHYDITEKQCPLFFVTHEDKWLQFKEDVEYCHT